MKESRELWTNLHKESRYRPKYPSETVVQYVFRNFKRDGNEKVLDLGCGAGRHVFFMGTENIQPYGLDFSKEGIDYTKTMLTKMGMEQFVDNMEVGALTKLPFEDSYFDGIVCYGVLYYLTFSDIKLAVSEMERVLKRGGKFMCVVRSVEDYRCDEENCIKTEEENTYYINVKEQQKCANSENGMIMHFFKEDEIRELFKNFENVQIDKIVETHNNGEFCDSNYIITGSVRL